MQHPHRLPARVVLAHAHAGDSHVPDRERGADEAWFVARYGYELAFGRVSEHLDDLLGRVYVRGRVRSGEKGGNSPPADMRSAPFWRTGMTAEGVER